MATQISVINMTHHNMVLKLHKSHTLKWSIHECSAFSWSLPISANHVMKYKIKADGKIIAKIFVNHNGIIVNVRNLSKRFSVFAQENHHFNRWQYRNLNTDGSVWEAPRQCMRGNAMIVINDN